MCTEKITSLPKPDRRTDINKYRVAYLKSTYKQILLLDIDIILELANFNQKKCHIA